MKRIQVIALTVSGLSLISCTSEEPVSAPACDVTCAIGWFGELEHDEGAVLEVRACWNDECGDVVIKVATADEIAEYEEARERFREDAFAAHEEQLLRERDDEGSWPAGPPPSGGVSASDETEEEDPCGQVPGCDCGAIGSDFPFRTCGVPSASPGMIRFELLINPLDYTPGQGQDRLQNGDRLSLRVRSPEGDVLVDQTVVAEYTVLSTDDPDVCGSSWPGRSCRGGGFDLEGNPLD